MKKSILFSLLFLSLNGLYAMEMELSEVGEKEQPSRIKLEDAVQHISKYKHEYGNVYTLCWSPDGRYLASAAFCGNTKIFDVTTGAVEVESEHYSSLLETLCWIPGRYGVSVASDDVSSECKHNGWLKFVRRSDPGCKIQTLINPNDSRKVVIDCRSFGVSSLSPDGRYIATSRGGHGIRIASFMPYLLSTHQLQEDAILSQCRLLERLQKKLLNEKKTFVIDQSDRTTLEGMPDVQEMLALEPKSKGKNPTWKAQLKGVAKK